MKVLWFWRYNRYYNKDENLHTGFALDFAKTADIDLKFYGPYLEDILPENSLVSKFQGNIMMKDILSKFYPDIMIFNTRSRMFWQYAPKDFEHSTTWLPYGWNEVKIPRVCIEEDYHYILDDSWYFNNGINLLLQRHYPQSLRVLRVQNKWFPFGVNTDIFKPNIQIVRKNKIAFVGSLDADVYIYRKEATRRLQRLQLIDIYSKEEKVGANYIKCLQEYAVCLNGSSIYHITAAKMFEIMACGAVLFTNVNPDLNLLFPEDCYIPYDIHNIEDNAQYILSNKDYQKEISQKALNCILQNHTNKIRSKQLKEILENELQSVPPTN